MRAEKEEDHRPLANLGQRKSSFKDFLQVQAQQRHFGVVFLFFCLIFLIAISTILVLWLNAALAATFFPSEPTGMVTCSLWCGNMRLWSYGVTCLLYNCHLCCDSVLEAGRRRRSVTVAAKEKKTGLHRNKTSPLPRL